MVAKRRARKKEKERLGSTRSGTNFGKEGGEKKRGEIRSLATSEESGRLGERPGAPLTTSLSFVPLHVAR